MKPTEYKYSPMSEKGPPSAEKAVQHLFQQLNEITVETHAAEVTDQAQAHETITSENPWVRRAVDFKNFTHSLAAYPDKLFRELDARIRGRDVGPSDLRLARIGWYHALAEGSGFIDSITEKLTPKLKKFGPLGTFATYAIERVTDELIKKGVDTGINNLTGVKDYHFASNLSEKTAALLNWFPSIRATINPVSVEARVREVMQVPVAGAYVEKAYRAANAFFDQVDGFLDQHKSAKWVVDLFIPAAKVTAANHFDVFGKSFAPKPPNPAPVAPTPAAA